MAVRITFAIGVLTLIAVGTNTLAAEDSRHVLVIKEGQRIGSDGRVVDTVRLGTVLKIEFAERDRYWLKDCKVGWLDKSKVMPADQKAIAYLN